MRSVYDEGGVNTGEKMYHKTCLDCTVCHTNLSAKAFYIVDGRPHCEAHYMAVNFKICATCSTPITVELVEAGGKTYHPECLSCSVCNKSLNNARFMQIEGKLICEEDYQARNSYDCAGCKKKIIPVNGVAECLRVGEDKFHNGCFHCQVCPFFLDSF